MPVLVLARRGELVDQNSETFWDCGVKNSIYSASVGTKSTHYPIIVGSEGTVARALNGELKSFAPTILLIDECHEVDFDSPDSQYMTIIATLQKRNPALRVIGLTGSPYRGVNDILGSFWGSCAYRIRTPLLVERGFLVPTFFGYEAQQQKGYDLKDFHVHGGHDPSDFTQKELLAMQRKITKDQTVTQQIMAEVVEITKNRNKVLITGAGKKHLEQIAECLPDGSYCTITESTGSRERRENLKEAAKHDSPIKYILQIGCLTTGYDNPLIDTSVIMRKIGSLTLLTQLLGRGMRLLKDHQKEAGVVKNDHLVLDYSDTLEEMAEIYQDPILERSQLDKSRREKDLITCPVCSTLNSSHARRCINRNENNAIPQIVNGIENYSIDGRCEHFWSSRECPSCKTLNDTTAKECRKCDQLLIDPNANLKGKHYTDDDFREVVKMSFRLTKAGDGVLVDYLIRSEASENDKVILHNGEQLVKATEILHPERRERWATAPWRKFLNAHLHRSWHGRIIGKSAAAIVKQAAIFDCPKEITHRTKPDGKSIIHRKRFNTGRISEK
jgi:superfamily II DNA or RNA helicase